MRGKFFSFQLFKILLLILIHVNGGKTGGLNHPLALFTKEELEKTAGGKHWMLITSISVLSFLRYSFLSTLPGTTVS